MTTLAFTYTWSKWDEGPLTGFAHSLPSSSPLKFTKIASDRVFAGDFTGTGWDESVMVYHPMPEGEYSATYSGLVHVRGKVGEEEGEAVFLVQGRYTDAEGPVSEWRLDEKSASGCWAGKRAAGGDGRSEGDKKVMLVRLRVHDA
ncbi:hypothetical protein CALVIDRAFT_563230 [Calocera viscosa TUFC12733]|uniref:Uncharacterized protein n=1 Tax=Calocera viscosa (strain TUFC12733) TaxID=1330018 RepID=A0A167MRZ8_CALVF|nr:hypothetical protein CALVIDRAFT_563230 [Calocera viscosa TUFC12733]